MSKAPTADSSKQPTSTAAPVFNYAAAAAKRVSTNSNPTSQSTSPNLSGTSTPVTPSAPATTTDSKSNGKSTEAAAPRTAASIVAGNANNSKSSLPSTSSNLNPASKAPAVNGTSNAVPASQARRQSAVNLPKAGTSGKPTAAINFGSVQDQNATLSSSPATQPKIGETPTTFGSVPAAGSEPKEKVVGGFAGKGEEAKPSAASATEKTTPSGVAPEKKSALDFQKLFQKGGAGSTSGAAAAASTTSTSASNPPSATSTPQVSNASSTASPATTNQTSTSSAPSQQATASHSFTPSQNNNAQRNTPSNLRPQQPHAGAREFQSMRSPSQSHPGQGQRAPSGNYSHHQNQPRSPHMPNAGMQQMHQMGSPLPQWQGPGPNGQPMQQQQQYYQSMYNNNNTTTTYGYNPQHPQQWQPAQNYGADMGNGTPRSPHHANVPASPMGAGMTPSGPSSSISSPPPAFSPAARPGAHLNHTPSTSTSAVGSPQQLGMGQPTTPGRPSSFTPSHQHTPSFGSMSPAAAKFEPSKRASSAIRIVNPDTQKDIVAPKVSTPTEASKSAVSSPAVTKKVDSPALASAAATDSSSSAAASVDDAAVQAAGEKSKSGVQENFMQRIKEAAEKAKLAKGAAATADAEKTLKEEKEKAEAAKKQQETAAAEKKAAEEKAEKERKQKVEEERKEKEAKEAKEKEEAELKEKERKETEEKAKAEKEAADKKTAEQEAAAAAAAAAATSEAEGESEKTKSEESKSKLQPIDTAKASAPPQSPASQFRGSAADVERMAREASSVPSTPMEGPPRTPVPSTPRTPGGTPGFAGLPARPMSSIPASASGGSIKLSTEALEKRKRPVPEQLDTASAQKALNDSPMSAASTSLNSAKFIENINSVAYPSKINSPKPGLNENAEPGKFKYDRDFLLQFMGVYKEAPQALPPLSQLGMEGGQALGSRSGARRSGGMAPPASGRSASTGLGIMGGAGGGSAFGGKGAAFGAPGKTSEERFARASGAGGMAFSGPMGSFNAGARSQPLSRGGSGSNSVPSREMMGSGAPAGGRTKSGRGKQRNINDNGGGRGHVNPPEKGGPTIPLDQVAPLANSENRWQPQAAQGSRGGVKENSPEMVQRKVKALLNKLTVERFDSISDQILEWANKSVQETDGRTLRQVIALVFEKATDEAAWSEMYARLSQKLLHKVSPEVKDESLIGADGNPVVGGSLFRKYLLSRCQEDFERGWGETEALAAAAKDKEQEDKAKKESNDKAEAEAKEAEERGEKKGEEKEAELLSDEYYLVQKAKRRGLGLIRFIGELFKLQMLTERIMHGCIKKLLSNASDPEEEEIESLCKLLTTVGKPLDTARAEGHMDIYFKRMRETADSPAINSRMRFMLLEVIELRNRKWVPRHANTDPKTISQIHAEAAKAKQQQEAEAYNRAQGGGRGGPMSRGGSRRGQQREFGAPSADGFTTVGGAAPPPRPTKVGDLSGFGKIERSGSGRPLNFNHTSVFNKKTAKGGSEDGSNPPTRTNSTTNMFHLLGKGDEADAAPAESQRPKLNLAPRTIPLRADGEEGQEDGEGKEDGEGEDEDEDEDEDEAETEAPADLSDEEAKRKIGNDVKEYFELRDVKEASLAIEALPINRRAEFIAAIVGEALNKKESDIQDVADLLGEMRKQSLIEDAALSEGLKDQVEFLDDVSIDVPQAYKFMAIILVGSGLEQDKVESLAETIQGDGIVPPKTKLLNKVKEVQEA